MLQSDGPDLNHLNFFTRRSSLPNRLVPIFDPRAISRAKYGLSFEHVDQDDYSRCSRALLTGAKCCVPEQIFDDILDKKRRINNPIRELSKLCPFQLRTGTRGNPSWNGTTYFANVRM